jgi:uncharacterized protein with PIN domain
MARFYSNENFPLGVVQELRKLGHDVLTSHEAGKANQSIPDDEVLKFATGEKRVLLTLNRRDFIKLDRDTRGRHAGIVVCTQDTDHPGQARRIHDQVAGAGEMAGRLLRVNRPV